MRLLLVKSAVFIASFMIKNHLLQTVIFFTLIAAMSFEGCGRGLLGKGLAPAGDPPGTNLHSKNEKKKLVI